MAPSIARVGDFCAGLPEAREFDDVIIRTRRIGPHTVLFTLYGRHVLDYIAKSLGFRSTDPYSYANEVIRTLFHRVFGEGFKFSFNQNLRLEKALLLPRLRELAKKGYSLGKFITEYEKSPDSFVSVEIDAAIRLETEADPPRRFEIKMVTCPEQSGRVLSQYLYPGELARYFITRDYLGFITFATIRDAMDAAREPAYPDSVPASLRTGWILHFAVIDSRVLDNGTSALDKAEVLLDAMRDDHAFFAGKLNLNTDGCSIKLIENYVKVIHMAYVIEQLKQDLAKEIRKREEETRKREEERRQRIKAEKEKAILLKALKAAGIKSPLDDSRRDEDES